MITEQRLSQGTVRRLLLPLGTFIAGLLLSWVLFGIGGEKPQQEEHHRADGSSAAQVGTTWTCSMHPQIRQPEAGNCPICGMDLIPVETADDNANMRRVKLSPRAMQLANVSTVQVKQTGAQHIIDVNGEVVTSESSRFVQTAHVAGRIESLKLNYFGQQFEKGVVFAQIYSPQVMTVQQELLRAYQQREQQPQLYAAVRSKLANWKFSTVQIDQLIADKDASGIVDLYSDNAGQILRLNIREGDYVVRGQRLFEAVNFNSLWVEFDVYESDIASVSRGDSISFSVNAYPGKIFRSRIEFIEPLGASQTGTVKVRTTLKNIGNRFKPSMYVRGRITASRQSGSEAADGQLQVPKSAILWTGERSIVYAKTAGDEIGVFELREVLLGPALGNSYVVLDGVEAGDELVANGLFSVDAAAQLAGNASMMNPGVVAIRASNTMVGPGDASSHTTIQNVKPVSIGVEARAKLAPVFSTYLELKDALVNDDFKQARAVAGRLSKKLEGIDVHVFVGEAKAVWLQHGEALRKSMHALESADEMATLRTEFKPVSDNLIALARAFPPDENTFYVQYCPMALGNAGGNWLSTESKVLNPYFGASMLHCGEVLDSLAP